VTALLLDTHVLVWMMDAPERIGKKARGAIERAGERGQLLVSAVSFREIALLIDEKRIDLGGTAYDIRRRVMQDGIDELPVNGEQAIDAAGLAGLPGDPMDRFIVAAARHTRAQLMTADTAILAWDGSVKRLDATE
jgi:PIN domain nuclease of toxin-antitoxin system